MIRQIESEVDKPVLLLDGGALLFEQPLLPQSQLSTKTMQARGISRAMEAMNYAAIGAAPQDLAAGAEFLAGQRNEHRLPLISANLVDRTGKKILKPSLLTKVGETTVAVIGLTGETAGQTDADYRILPWRDVLPDTLKEVRAHAEMTVLLSSYPETVNREIAAELPDIHLIIQAGTSSASKNPQLVGNTLFAQVAGRGKYLGRLDIDWHPSRRWSQGQDSPPRLQQTRDSLDRITWRLGRLEKRTPNREELAQSREYQQLLLEQARLTAEIARLEQPAPTTADEPSTYTSTLIPLKVTLPEDPEVQKIVVETKQEINRAGQRQQQETKKTDVRSAGMTGWAACRSCHPEQTAFWEKSGHAGAWQTLAGAQQQFNQNCLPCHVTLPASEQPAGAREQLLTALPPELQTVGCEACHGPGGRHVASPKQAPPPTLTATTCLACHTPEHDSDFDYDRKLPLIRCPTPALNNKGAA